MALCLLVGGMTCNVIAEEAGAPVPLGEAALSHSTEEPEVERWCESWKKAGRLYSNPEHPWFQEFNLIARFQYQYAYVDGTDSQDNRFSYNTDEIRRFYVGARMEFLRFLEGQVQWDIFEDYKPKGGDRGVLKNIKIPTAKPRLGLKKRSLS